MKALGKHYQYIMNYEYSVLDSQILLRDRHSRPDTWSRTSLVWISYMAT